MVASRSFDKDNILTNSDLLKKTGVDFVFIDSLHLDKLKKVQFFVLLKKHNYSKFYEKAKKSA